MRAWPSWPRAARSPAGRSCTRPRPDPGAPRRVIVVGAGLAGLTAALRLRDAGWDVVVLEARARASAGGCTRCYGGDDGVPFDRGLRAEVGGESIDDTHTSLRKHAAPIRPHDRTPPGKHDRAGPSDGRVPLPRADVHVRGADGAARRHGARRLPARRRRARSGSPSSIASIPSIPKRPTAPPSSIAMSFATWLDSLHLVPEARFVAEQANMSLYNAQLADLSMLFVAQQTAVTAGHARQPVGDDARRGRQRDAPEGDRGRARLGADPRRAGDRRCAATATSSA